MPSPPHSPAHADGTLPVDAPLRVHGAEAAWDAACDVLVVGYGAAGAAAAIAAKEAGADVLVAERFEGGGASTKSGGVVYAGGGTKQQKAHGYEDTPDEMFRYLRREVGEAVGEATLRRFCADSVGLIEWLETLGCDFTSSTTPPKTSYPKDGVYLYYSGNESVPDYAAEAKPAPRGHRTRGSWMSGKVLYELLRARAEKLGIAVRCQTSARRLIVDESSGAVLGAQLWQLVPGSAAARRHAKLMQRAEKMHNYSPRRADALRAQALALELAEARPLRVRARGGVILTTGGFIFNREMVRTHAPKYTKTLRLGATGCDGSGIRLGQSAGAAADRLDKVSAWRFINPPGAWPLGIVVDEQGRRFCNEQVYGAKLGVAMCEEHGGKAWLILDRKLRRQAIKEALFGGLWFFQSVPALILMLFAPRAQTPEQLAEKVGMPAPALADELRRYNDACFSGTADALRKAESMRAALVTPPYYAMDIGAANKLFPCPAITLGGLRVDEASGTVLDLQGAPIAGLYAAGRTAVGIASNGYVSGLSLADCLWSGRRAGAHAAEKRIPSPSGGRDPERRDEGKAPLTPAPLPGGERIKSPA